MAGTTAMGRHDGRHKEDPTESINLAECRPAKADRQRERKEWQNWPPTVAVCLGRPGNPAVPGKPGRLVTLSRKGVLDQGNSKCEIMEVWVCLPEMA